MSQKVFPIVFINLSGEMLYILDQRLRAQNISKEKSSKVMYDIISTMFNNHFVDELFKPQHLHTRQALKTIFERLVHSSIMRLNGTSMDKLYDLMTMVCKYQFTMCPRAEDVLLVTLNHLDGIRQYSEDSEEMIGLVDNVYNILYSKYAHLSPGEFQLIHYNLLAFFEDLHIRVSVLLKMGVQKSDGCFVVPKDQPVPPGLSIPREVGDSGLNVEEIFNKSIATDYQYEESFPTGSLEREGDRRITLGKNIYLEHENSDGKMPLQPLMDGGQKYSGNIDENYKHACEELSFLGRLIGQKEVRAEQPEFTLGIFDGESVEITSGSIAENTVVNIDISERMQSKFLHKIIGELTIEEQEPEKASEENNDILELLDVASS